MAVYFIRAGEIGPVKIGVSNDVSSRLRGLQTSHHEKLILIREMDGGTEEERQLHRIYADFRLAGEWFKWCDTMLSVVPRPQAMKTDVEIEKDLRRWRARLGLTQGRAAAMFGITLRTYKRWEADGPAFPKMVGLACRMIETSSQPTPSTPHHGP